MFIKIYSPLHLPSLAHVPAFMKTLTKELWMEVPQRRAIVSIHNQVEQLVAESEVQDGIVLVNAMHITAVSYTHLTLPTICSV